MSLLDIFIFPVCSGALLASHVRTLLVGKRGSVSGALNSARTLQPIVLCPARLRAPISSPSSRGLSRCPLCLPFGRDLVVCW